MPRKVVALMSFWKGHSAGQIRFQNLRRSGLDATEEAVRVRAW
jgi:hypothetical protein